MKASAPSTAAKAQPLAVPAVELQVLWQDIVATYRNRLSELQKARIAGAPTVRLLTMLVNESEKQMLALCTAADKIGPEYQAATSGARAAVERNRALRATGGRVARA